MHLRFVLAVIFIGCAAAQRGHYAGASRPITGQRYESQGQNNLIEPSQQRFSNPSYGGFGASPYNFHQQPGAGFANPNIGGFGNFGGFPTGFYGR